MLNLASDVKENVFSLELITVMLIYYNIYSKSPYFQMIGDSVGIGSDFNILLVISTGFIVLYRYKRQEMRISRIGAVALAIYGLFAFYAAISMFWTLSSTYAIWKLTRILIMIPWMFFLGIVITQESDRFSRFIFLLSIFSVLVSIEIIYAFLINSSRWILTDLDYLSVSRPIGFGILIFLYYTSQYNEINYSLGLAGLIGLMFSTMFLTGARGPLVSLVLAGSLFVILSLYHSYKYREVIIERWMATLAACSSLVGIVMYGFLLLFGIELRTIERLLILLGDNPGDSAAGRIDFFFASVDFWLQKPITGHGIGSYALLYFGEDSQHYPHNLLLEIGVELGLIGLVIMSSLLVLVVSWLFWQYITRDNRESVLLLSLFIYMFLNTMITGDMSINRDLFLILGLMILPTKYHKTGLEEYFSYFKDRIRKLLRLVQKKQAN